jgi:CheY-like chemotaxis protein
MGTFLVVDDQLLIRDLFQEILSNMGHKVHLASNGLEALRAINSTEFDLIISDYTMPGMNGEKFLEAVRKINKTVPFIFLTGNKAINLDHLPPTSVQGFLAKPFKIHQLEETINQVLGW